MSKRKRNDENQPTYEFINNFGPPLPPVADADPQPTKKIRRRRSSRILKDSELTPQVLAEGRKKWEAANALRLVEESKRVEAARVEAQKKDAERLQNMVTHIKEEGYGTLYGFMEKLLTTKDRKLSSQVSNLLTKRGDDIVRLMVTRKPTMFDEHIKERTKKLQGSGKSTE